MSNKRKLSRPDSLDALNLNPHIDDVYKHSDKRRRNLVRKAIGLPKLHDFAQHDVHMDVLGSPLGSPLGRETAAAVEEEAVNLDDYVDPPSPGPHGAEVYVIHAWDPENSDEEQYQSIRSIATILKRQLSREVYIDGNSQSTFSAVVNTIAKIDNLNMFEHIMGRTTNSDRTWMDLIMAPDYVRKIQVEKLKDFQFGSAELRHHFWVGLRKIRYYLGRKKVPTIPYRQQTPDMVDLVIRVQRRFREMREYQQQKSLPSWTVSRQHQENARQLKMWNLFNKPGTNRRELIAQLWYFMKEVFLPPEKYEWLMTVAGAFVLTVAESHKFGVSGRMTALRNVPLMPLSRMYILTADEFFGGQPGIYPPQHWREAIAAYRQKHGLSESLSWGRSYTVVDDQMEL